MDDKLKTTIKIAIIVIGVFFFRLSLKKTILLFSLFLPVPFKLALMPLLVLYDLFYPGVFNNLTFFVLTLITAFTILENIDGIFLYILSALNLIILVSTNIFVIHILPEKYSLYVYSLILIGTVQKIYAKIIRSKEISLKQIFSSYNNTLHAVSLEGKYLPVGLIIKNNLARRRIEKIIYWLGSTVVLIAVTAKLSITIYFQAKKFEPFFLRHQFLHYLQITGIYVIPPIILGLSLMVAALVSKKVKLKIPIILFIFFLTQFAADQIFISKSKILSSVVIIVVKADSNAKNKYSVYGKNLGKSRKLSAVLIDNNEQTVINWSNDNIIFFATPSGQINNHKLFVRDSIGRMSNPLEFTYNEHWR